MSDGCRCCSRCGHKTSVTAGTIFDRHRILLKHWFITGWYLAELENGISALELQQEFGLGSYQSAWTIAHKLRSAMSLAVQDRLYDSAVVDITYVGGIQKSVSGRQTNRQSVVAVAAQIVTPWEQRRVRLSRLHDDSSDSLLGFVCKTIEPGCCVHTDKIGDHELHTHGYDHGGSETYLGQSVERYRPDFEAWEYKVGNTLTELQISAYLQARGPSPPLIDDSNEAYSLHALLPWVRRVSSELEAWLSRTHRGAGAITEAHLDAYLDEFSFRINFRREHYPGLLFHRLLKAAVATPPARFRPTRRRAFLDP
jgi:hypothetical protein